MMSFIITIKILLEFKLNYVHDFLDWSFAIERNFAFGAEANDTRFQGEKGMILAETEICASHDSGAALADDNRARLSWLTGCKLNT